MAGNEPSDEGGTDWRRLASDRNVSHGVARALWEQARAAAPGDAAQAEHAFGLMLDEAEAANITHEPGRETLAGATPNAKEASSLGPGKWTRVLLEQPKAAGTAKAAGTVGAANASAAGGAGAGTGGAEGAKRPSAEGLRAEIVAAGQAGKDAAAMLAASDAATIVEALRGLGGQGGALQKLVTAAGGVVERVLNQRPAAQPQSSTGMPQAQPGESPTKTSAPSASQQSKTGDAQAKTSAPSASQQSKTGDAQAKTSAPSANQKSNDRRR